ncbi:protein shuttle craft [Drosophila grimshawi]|uniref:GH10921 n=1 Tax=Drosophila grimshawi TaxID=7222 RepID=B4JAX9_DROGR|nr:protein shuttle craft [Drosophila grimshawi]EDW02849.1 GH10921 [Drosophila grimshawi]
MAEYWQQQQQQQQLQQQQQQPPTQQQQLTNGAAAHNDSVAAASIAASVADCNGQSNNNNNYVNFNQFITQHNLHSSNLGYSSGGVGSGGAFGLTPASSSGSAANNSSFGVGQYAAPIFGYQNGDGAGQNCPNLYSAFGNNPFAAPAAAGAAFDFSASKLQATAPEFVPNFAKLSLSTSKTNSSSSNSNNNNNSNNSNTATTQQTPHEAASSNAQRGLAKPLAGGNNTRQQQRRQDYREDRHEDRYERGKKPQKQQRYDNHRSNKRRDDWNRNRDRINGYPRAADELDTSNSNDSAQPSPEKQLPHQVSPRRAPDNEKLSQREKLMRDIEQRRLECLVCVEQIKAHHGTWSCQNCYHVLHLKCTITWASSSKSAEGWRCPACQNVLQELPREYLCFCGKLKNPPLTRNELAHTCGELCCRVEGCSHACTLLCHPGPCPPCQANVLRSCGCGRTSKLMQCAMKQQLQCEATCDKPLNCAEHRCQQLCHAGKCEPCAEQVEQHCHCGKQQREVLCTKESQDRRSYSCKECCGKPLPCGNHKCKDSCHAGACRPCKLSPQQITSCPCGKLAVPPTQRSSCLDPVPTCEGACSKTLRCGKPAHPHQCASKCHLGQCPPCPKQTAVKCRCGHMDQLIKCRQLSTRADDARCKRRCTKKRSCGKHKCNAECCIDIDHACPLPCNRTLSCGKHKCDQPCHRGNCPPCYRSSFEELYCECGAEVIYPPVPCGTKRPPCKRPCSRTHGCEHVPQHSCHAAASCPPCMMFTTKWCHGNHEQRKTIPCSQASFSCGFPCAKPLACGRHKCIRPCHEGECPQPGELCRQSCTKPRLLCGHKCAAVCHDGACPETPCKELVEVQCECGNRKQSRSCQELAREHSRIATAQLASSMAEMSRGNYMELSEILAPTKNNKSNKTLDCNEECRLLERNRRLAIGLQSRNPESQLKSLTKYSEFLRGFAKRNPVLTKSVYETLSDLVKLAKESKQKSRSHSFPTMNREKRQMVHELCEVFGVESVSYDKEPNRNVVATAHKERCWLPATSVMDVLARESGQRRVPVPSNNVWGIKK